MVEQVGEQPKAFINIKYDARLLQFLAEKGLKSPAKNLPPQQLIKNLEFERPINFAIAENPASFLQNTLTKFSFA